MALSDAATPVNLTNVCWLFFLLYLLFFHFFPHRFPILILSTLAYRGQHTYWNLAGPESGSTVLEHEVSLNADRFLPVDASLIPTGELKPVRDASYMDFLSKPHTIGARIAETGGGYDHCFLLADHSKPAATVYEPRSGRVLQVSTNQPAVQFYSGNFLSGLKGAGGAVFNKHCGFCLEPEGYVDAVNQPAFPGIVLRPGDTYRHNIVFKFSTKTA